MAWEAATDMGVPYFDHDKTDKRTFNVSDEGTITISPNDAYLDPKDWNKYIHRT